MVLTPNEEWQFPTVHIGQRILVYDEVESTNSLATSFTSTPGVAIVARNQTAGRGQHGRTWLSRPGAALLLSVVLDTPPEIRRASILTAWAAVAVGDAIYSHTSLQARIKWPNDLLVHGKKICGILIEQGAATVVGIGLNLNQSAAEFADAGLPDATSLRMLTSRETQLRDAVGSVIAALDGEYRRLLEGERIAVESDWKWRMGLLGRPVVLDLTDGTVLHGRMREMSFDHLQIETEDGSVRSLVPESVVHVRAVTV